MVMLSGIVMRTTFAALLLAALFALAPSKADAHAGHVHPAALKHVETSAPADGAQAAELKRQIVVEVSAASVPFGTDHAGLSDCGDRGCCANGHCGSFCGVIAPAWLVIGQPAASSAHLSSNAAPPVGLATGGPARPPKSIA